MRQQAGYWGGSELIRGRKWSGTVQVSDGNEVVGQVPASASLEATGPKQVLEFRDPDTGFLVRRGLTPYQLVFHSDGPGGGVDAVCDLVEVRTTTTN
jgi:hypothetical protein